MRKASPEKFRNYVLDQYRQGAIVTMSDDTAVIMSSKNFIRQPADGILFDLDLMEEQILADYQDRSWVNRYATTQTIRALKERIAELEGK